MKVLLWIMAVIAGVFVFDSILSTNKTATISSAGPVIDAIAHPGEPMEMLFRDLANANGQSCATITQVNPIGRTTGGQTLIAVACSGGERYAFSVTGDQKISYVSSCSTFQGVTGKSCF